MPVDSTRMWSGASSRARRSSSWSRSSRRVQQIHPLENSTTRSAVRTTRRASTFTSARSFTSTATRFPSSPVRRRWLIRVVFPAPRKPTRTVTGMGVPILAP